MPLCEQTRKQILESDEKPFEDLLRDKNSEFFKEIADNADESLRLGIHRNKRRILDALYRVEKIQKIVMGETWPLQEAVDRGSINAVNFLLKPDSKTKQAISDGAYNPTSDNFGVVVLDKAIKSGRVEMVNHLLNGECCGEFGMIAQSPSS